MEIKINKMKRLFAPFLFLLCLGLVPNAKAQFKIGATTGANFNTFGQPGMTLGGNVGAFGRYQVLEFLEAQAELKYTLLGGGRHDFQRSFVSGENELSSIQTGLTSVNYLNRSTLLHGIELPISARLGLPELNESFVVPKFVIGFSVSYLFSAYEQSDAVFNYGVSESVLFSDVQENVGADFNALNLGYFGGFALDFNLENEKVFTVEFRYLGGINNLNEAEDADPFVTEELRPRSFSVNFAYQIF